MTQETLIETFPGTSTPAGWSLFSGSDISLTVNNGMNFSYIDKVYDGFVSQMQTISPLGTFVDGDFKFKVLLPAITLSHVDTIFYMLFQLTSTLRVEFRKVGTGVWNLNYSEGGGNLFSMNVQSYAGAYLYARLHSDNNTAVLLSTSTDGTTYTQQYSSPWRTGLNTEALGIQVYSAGLAVAAETTFPWNIYSDYIYYKYTLPTADMTQAYDWHVLVPEAPGVVYYTPNLTGSFAGASTRFF